MTGMGTPEFYEACYRILRSVPAGRVTTYGDLARALGRPGAARAVGNAMRLNRDAPRTPCHRVVPSDGRVGNYSGPYGVVRKVQLLRLEGVRMQKDGRIANFEAVRWRPPLRARG